MRGVPNTLEDFWRFVNPDGPLPRECPQLGLCWRWLGAITGHGYGSMRLQGKSVGAHQVGYKLLRGDVPNGLELDHLCRNRACVNPYHLEAVTPKVNKLRGVGFAAMQARKTYCKHGHPFSGDNLMLRNNRGRDCRICHRIQGRKAAARLRARTSSS
jgi:HNH endonuclease